MFIIYSKESCPNCEKAKMFLYMKGKEFKVKKLDTDFDVKWFMDEFKVRSFPVIVDTSSNTTYKSFEELSSLI